MLSTGNFHSSFIWTKLKTRNTEIFQYFCFNFFEKINFIFLCMCMFWILMICWFLFYFSVRFNVSTSQKHEISTINWLSFPLLWSLSHCFLFSSNTNIHTQSLDLRIFVWKFILLFILTLIFSLHWRQELQSSVVILQMSMWDGISSLSLLMIGPPKNVAKWYTKTHFLIFFIHISISLHNSLCWFWLFLISH